MQYILQSKYYLEEVTWCNKNYMPSFKDQVELSSMSAGAPVLTLAALMAVGATKETFEWASCVPDMVRACGEIGRFLNDISAYKVLIHAATGSREKQHLMRFRESKFRKIWLLPHEKQFY